MSSYVLVLGSSGFSALKFAFELSQQSVTVNVVRVLHYSAFIVGRPYVEINTKSLWWGTGA